MKPHAPTSLFLALLGLNPNSDRNLGLQGSELGGIGLLGLLQQRATNPGAYMPESYRLPVLEA